jgi:hypothetical protein
MKPTEAVRIVSMVAQAFSTPAWSMETQELYARMIEDLDRAPTETAVMRLIRARSVRPTIADIRHAVREELEHLDQLPTDPEPDQAWGVVVKQITRANVAIGDLGDRLRRVFTSRHAAITATVERLGWHEIRMSVNVDTVRAQFRDAYRAELARRRQDRVAAPGLRLADDCQRLAGQAPEQVGHTPVLRIDDLPPSEERARVAEGLHDLAAALATGMSMRIAPPVERPEVPQLRLERPDELEAARRRKVELRAQLAEMAGGQK